MANSDLRWERTKAYNAGIDFGMFEGRFSGSLNAYYQSTDDLLLERSLPAIVGFDDIMSNLGQVDNRGIEISMRSVNVDIIDVFNWKSTLTFSLNRNEIVHLYGNQVPIKDEQGNVIGHKEASDWGNGWYIGHSLHAIRDYKNLDTYKTGEAEEAAAYGKDVGEFEVLDVNNDTTYQPKDDYVFQGKTEPQYRISLMNSFTLWKNLQISFLIRSWLDYKGVNNYHHNSNYTLVRANGYKKPYWTEENQLDNWEKISHGTSGLAVNYYEDRSFVRLQNLSISYQIPDRFIQQSAISRARIYFNLQNGPTWTNWTHWDPETGSPTPRRFMFGVNVTL
jgi:hypothetical protein